MRGASIRGPARAEPVSPPHFETASQPRTTTVTKRLSRSARSQSSWSPSRPRRSRYSPPPSSASRAAHRLPQSRTILPPRRAHRRAPRGGSGQHRELARRLAFIAGAMPLPQLPQSAVPFPLTPPAPDRPTPSQRGTGCPLAYSPLGWSRVQPCWHNGQIKMPPAPTPPAIGSCQPSF